MITATMSGPEDEHMIRGLMGRFLTLILAPLFVIGATALCAGRDGATTR